MDKLYVDNTFASKTYVDNTFLTTAASVNFASGNYVDNTFLTRSLFEVSTALPGLPVTYGIAMAFIPTVKTCSVSSNGTIYDIIDPLTGIALGAPTGFRSEFKRDSDGVFYLDFSNPRLFKDQVSVSDLGGPNGNTSTFFIVMKAKAAKQQSNFNWVKETGTNTYNTRVRLGVHIPYANGVVYIDHASSASGRLQVAYGGKLNQKQVWAYRRNGSWADLHIKNVFHHSVNNLTSKFASGDVGRFMIGNGNNLNDNATMDFYGLLFYNRNLNNDEMKEMDLYIKGYFKI